LPYEIPWWVELPSILAIYEGLFALFDRRLWRWRVFRLLGWVRVPNLNGCWDGDGSSSHASTRYQPTLEIRQTWTKLCVLLDTELSESHSLVGSIALNSAGGPTISYQYENQRKPSALPTMKGHRGTTTLMLKDKPDGQVLAGPYYTDPERGTHGELRFKRRPTFA
jgi:hypothetical protein